jgi:hypothetical protein
VRGDTHQARTGAQCSLPGEAYRARHALAAADDEHMTAVALVSAPRPALQAAPQDPARNSPAHGLVVRAAVFRNVESVEHDRAAEPRTLTGEQSCLEPDERYRYVGGNSRPHYLAGIAMDAGRNIERHHARAMRIHCRNGLREFTAHVALEAAAKQCIHEQIGFVVQRTLPGHDNPAFGGKIPVGGRRIARQRFRIDEGDDRNDDPLLGRQSRDHVTVASIVAGSADHLPAARVGKAFASGANRGRAGSCHQCIARNALVFDRRTIDFAHGSNGIDFNG